MSVSLNIENRITAKTKKQARSVKRYAFYAAITSARTGKKAGRLQPQGWRRVSRSETAEMANELNDSDFQIFNKRV